MNRLTFHTILAVLTLHSVTPCWSQEFDFSGSVGAEVRAFLNDPQFPDQFKRFQPSLLLQPEFRLRFDESRVNILPFLRLDSRDSKRTHFDLREGYWIYLGEAWDLVLGVNKVFWGVTESRHLVDIINQTDFVEDIDDEDKLGQPMLNVSTQQDWGHISLFVLPRFRERTFPGEKGRLRFALPIDTDQVQFESSAEEWHVDYAARYSHAIGDWDLGAYVFYGTTREPTFRLSQDGKRFLPRYDLITQLGADLQYTYDAWLWKFEGIVREGHSQAFGAFVSGFEYTLYQILDSSADLGLLFEYLLDGRDRKPTRAPITFFEDDMFFGARLALNDEQDTEVLVGGIIDTADQSTLALVEAERRIGENWSVVFEGRIFLNVDSSNPLSNFADDSFLTLRLLRFF